MIADLMSTLDEEDPPLNLNTMRDIMSFMPRDGLGFLENTTPRKISHEDGSESDNSSQADDSALEEEEVDHHFSEPLLLEHLRGLHPTIVSSPP